MHVAFRLVASACVAVLADQPPDAKATGPEPVMDALAVMADLTLIDADCAGVVVNFGAGFRYAAAHGVPDVAMLPGGRRRAAFEAVLQARQASFGVEELCTRIVKNYMEALPASVTPIYRHADHARDGAPPDRGEVPANR